MVVRAHADARRPAGSSACHAERLSKVYGDHDTVVHALRDVTLDIPGRVFTAVMGPSGSGKSTLLHCLAALDTPTSGRVFIGDTELTALSRRRRARIRRDRIGFVFQSFNLVPTLDALENITLPQLLAGRPPDREWLDHIISRTGLGDRLHHRPSELSGGQQQRVALARALAGRPEVIFADEPTGNLDTAASGEMLTLLRDAVDQFDQTVVTVTHDPSIVDYADQILYFSDGRVVDRTDRSDRHRASEHGLPHVDSRGPGGTPGPDVSPRSDGQHTMRSRRRRQSDASAPGRPMVGSDDEVEVARQERWLQRIREQFEAEQDFDSQFEGPHDHHPTAQPATGTPHVDDTHPHGAGRRELPPEPGFDIGHVRHDDVARDPWATGSDRLPVDDDGWLPPERSWMSDDIGYRDTDPLRPETSAPGIPSWSQSALEPPGFNGHTLTGTTTPEQHDTWAPAPATEPDHNPAGQREHDHVATPPATHDHFAARPTVHDDADRDDVGDGGSVGLPEHGGPRTEAADTGWRYGGWRVTLDPPRSYDDPDPWSDVWDPNPGDHLGDEWTPPVAVSGRGSTNGHPVETGEPVSVASPEGADEPPTTPPTDTDEPPTTPQTEAAVSHAPIPAASVARETDADGPVPADRPDREPAGKRDDEWPRSQPLPVARPAAHLPAASVETVEPPVRVASAVDAPAAGNRPAEQRRLRPPAASPRAGLPPALASLRNPRRPDQTDDALAALQSLQRQLDRLDRVGDRRPGRDDRHGTDRRDRG